MSRGSRPNGIDPTRFYLQTDWTGGEAGEGIAVNQESDLYRMTANSILNMIPTDLGNLRIIRAFSKTVLSAGISIQQTINTKFNFYIVIHTKGIYTINKTNNTIISSINFTSIQSFTKEECTATLLENFLLVPIIENGTINRYDYEVSSIGDIGINSSFKNAIRNPIKNISNVKVDIYQVRNIKVSGEKALRPYKLSTTTLQEFDVVGGKLKFKYDPTLNITRYYYPYISDMINIEDIPNLVENDYYISIYEVSTLADGKWYIGNMSFEWDGLVNDGVSGNYYTSVSNLQGSIGETGLMNYGNMIELNNNTAFSIIAEYQNRMVVSDGKYIYFSKVDRYNYFINGIEADDSFFIKPTSINNEEVKVLRLITGRGLWIVTDKGIFLAGYNQIIKPSTLEIRLVATDDCTGEAVDIDGTLYYLTTENSLKAVQNTTGVKGYVDFSSNLVDKFEETDNIKYISSITMENKKFLLATLREPQIKSTDYEDRTEAEHTKNYSIGSYLYKELKINTFYRVSIESPLDAIGFDKKYTGGDSIYLPTKKLVKEAWMRLHQPPTYSSDKGYLLNDWSATITTINMRLLNEKQEGVKNVWISEKPIDTLNKSSIQGIFNGYTHGLSKQIAEVIDIRIETTESDRIVQIQGVELIFKVY